MDSVGISFAVIVGGVTAANILSDIIMAFYVVFRAKRARNRAIEQQTQWVEQLRAQAAAEGEASAPSDS